MEQQGPEKQEPAGQLPEEDARVVRSTAEEVRRYNRIGTKIEIALVAVGMVFVVVAVIAASFAFVRTKDLTVSNRRLLTALQDQQRRQAEGAQFAIDAVNCIRYSVLEHRWVNEEYHKEQAIKLGLPLPPHSPLPPRPTEEELTKACVTFDGPPPAPLPIVTTTTRRSE